MRSLEILLEVGGIELSEDEKLCLAAEKNDRYVKTLENLKESELLEGAEGLMKERRGRNFEVFKILLTTKNKLGAQMHQACFFVAKGFVFYSATFSTKKKGLDFSFSTPFCTPP